MSEEHRPEQLDADIEYAEKPEKTNNDSSRKNRILPWLLGALVLLGIYAVVDSSGESGIQTELTPEQVQTAEAVTETVNSYVEENGIPSDPRDIELAEGSTMVINDDGSWIVSTAEGQLISSPGALTPE